LVSKVDPYYLLLTLTSSYQTTCHQGEDEEKNIVAKEIKSWKGFEYALREPNAILFNCSSDPAI
jgi:hypothetical protein